MQDIALTTPLSYSVVKKPAANEILTALNILCEPGQTVEIRAKSREGAVYSGYGKDLDEIARQVEVLDSTDTSAIYLTLNPVNPALMARRSRIAKTRKEDPLTSDADIVGRRWLPIDLDPVRPAGVSSTDIEKADAQKKAGLIMAYLTGLGWPAPVVGDSGNGYHLLYRIDLSNDDPARDLVKGCLEALSARFSDKVVSVDIKNFNAARIWKLYGTNARKGEDTADRPWRRAGLMSVPDPVVLVTRDLLEGLASELKAQKAPPAPIPSSKSPGKKEFDLAEWLAQYEPNIPCKVTPKNKPGHRYFYQLDPCPFSNGAHSDGAYLGQMNDGAVFAKCHHNSCGTGNRWRELRAIAEPGYTDRRNGKADKDVDEAKDEDTARILPFFEKDGRLYLDVIEPGGTFGFVHETNGSIRFDSRVIDGGDVITPAVLPVHHDTRETVFVVGVPRADLVKSAPLLSPAELYTLLDDHINRYCDMPTRDRELAVYYALYTWFYTKAPTSPYLRFLGDTGKGKSRLTEVVSDICIYPIKATGSSTTSGIMRFHERWRGTLVIDEGDLRGGAEDPLVKFLNIGFENGKYIILSDNENPKTQLIFLPYGPKVLAMRVPFKDNATEGRCLSYSPYETYRQDIPPELSPAYHSEVAELRAIITRFVLHHWQEVDGNEMMKYGDLDIERRLLQMARPVSIVLQLFPDGNTRFIEYLKYRQQEIKRTRSESWEGMLFNLAYSLAVGDETIDGVIPEAITAGAISEIFKAKSGTVTKALCSIGFETERERVTIYQKGGSASKKMVRKLVVPSPRTWKEITRRYWYRDDEIKAPDCPDILKGSRWIETQQKITSPNQNEHPNCDTCDTCDTSGEEGGGRNEQEIPTKVGDEDHTPHSASVTPVTSVTNKSDDDHTPRSTSVTPVTSVTPQTFSDLIKQYDLYPDLDLSGHASGKRAGSRCMCKGCDNPVQWASVTNNTRPVPLCDLHYQELMVAQGMKK